MEAIEKFRIETREWLEANCLDSMRTPQPENEVVWGGRNASFKNPDSKVWLERMAERGWTAPMWPKQYGGGGLNKAEFKILREEMAALKCRSPLASFGLSMLGPVLLEFADEHQKMEHLPKIVKGEIRWCQGYSEPNSGSDLANLGTRAVLDGDEWVVNGQKVWTSSGHTANWIFVLCRTTPDAPKHKGISFLLVPMDQEGVDCRPIINISNRHDFNEVFFSDAKTPKDHVVGDVNDGWRVANVLLGFERGHGATTDAVRFRDEFDRVLTVAQNRGADDDPLMRQDLARAHSKVEIMKWMGQRQVTSVLAGNPPGPESSLHKLLWSEYHTWFTEKTMHILGPEAMTPSGRQSASGIQTDAIGAEFSSLAWVQTMLGARPGTIYAGTSEVQRNIVGDRVLGLPREPRADSGPWNEIGKSN